MLGVEVGALATGLTPGLVIGLDGTWDGDRGRVQLPAPGERKPFTARRRLVLPDDWDPATPVTLQADAAGWRVTASVDGVQVDSVLGGLWPATLDLSGKLKPGSQQLALRFDAVQAGDVVEGELKAWTYDQPRQGWTAARGSAALVVGGGPRLTDLAVTADGGTLTVAVSGGEAAGREVALKVVRDGAVLAELPDLTLDDAGRGSVQGSWEGPRWTLGGAESPQLQTLVAELEGGGTAWLRFGVRDVEQTDRQLTLDGEPLYLAAQRYVPGRADPRQELADLAAWVSRTGSNAVELHGVIHSAEVLEAADELGLPVVFTPRCAGVARNDRPGALTPELAGFIAETNQAIADSRGDHPSILLWSQEEDAVTAWPRLYVPFEGDHALLYGRDSQGLDERRLQEAISRKRVAAWINELPWPPHVVAGQTLAQRLDPLLSYHRPWGTGLLLPHVYTRRGGGAGVPADVEQLGASFAELLGRHGVTPLPVGERRGPAELRVNVRRSGQVAAGVPVLLHLAEQPPLAAFSDEAGVAHFTVDYAGAAAVSGLAGTGLCSGHAPHGAPPRLPQSWRRRPGDSGLGTGIDRRDRDLGRLRHAGRDPGQAHGAGASRLQLPAGSGDAHPDRRHGRGPLRGLRPCGQPGRPGHAHLRFDDRTDGGNTGSLGAGIYLQFGTLDLVDSDIHENSSSGAGGGVFAQSASLQLGSSTVRANESPWGGGVYAWRSEVACESGGGGEASVQGNTATAGGGAYLAAYSTLTSHGCAWGDDSGAEDNAPNDVFFEATGQAFELEGEQPITCIAGRCAASR